MSPSPVSDRVLVVVPTYNEADNVDDLLEEIRQSVPEASVLFVDDASPDGTADRIRRQQEAAPDRIHLLSRDRKRGLGGAYVAGMTWALERGYLAAIEMDADLSHDAADLPRLIGLLEHFDCVVGSRYVEGGGTRNWSLPRRLISRWGSAYAQAILRLPIRDLTGGFNAWSRPVLEALPLEQIRSSGYAFQIELKYRAYLAGFSIHETPIVFSERRVGVSNMSWPIVFEAVFGVWRLALDRRSLTAEYRGGRAPVD